MAISSTRKRLIVAGLLGGAALAWCLVGSSRGSQTKAQPDADKPKGGPTKLYFGVSACSTCHTNADAYKKDPPLLCRCTEAAIWEKDDKHKNAYTVLLSERAKRMGEILGRKVAEDAACISCHAVHVTDQNLKHPTFRLEDGVSCVACHGAYKNWVDVHGGIDRLEWRKKTRQEKETAFGMTDLWDPAKRTKLCVSCHVGNTEEGKIVTHEMYAAGHPPLPSIEMSIFSDLMPRHWQYLKEKSAQAQKLLTYDPAELERTKLVVVGGAASMRDAMQMLAGQAQQAAQAKEADKQMLDVAQFDCYACHHELQRPSWRQERGYPSKPGRPQPRMWPLALVKLGMQHVGPDDAAVKAFAQQLHDRMGKLHQAFDIQPFGKPDDVAAAAREVAQWADQLATKVASAKYEQPAALSLLHKLCGLVAAETPDYDTARQMAWAFQVIYGDLNPKPATDAQIQQKLTSLSSDLKLDLPATQQRQILAELPVALQKIDTYGKDGPAQFKQTFAELAQLLSAK